MSPIQVSDPRAGYLAYQQEIDDAIAHCLTNGRYILGPEVAAFEQEWAAWLGSSQAIGVGNGTDAIELALRALGLGAGDIVITTSNTAVATVVAIELAGATPLLIEVDDRTLTLSPTHLEAALTQNSSAQKIRAVVPVHLYGQPADMPAIMALAKEHKLFVIEDCAQAHGARIGDQFVGTFGDAGAFSFYPTKNLGALGDGGAIVTNNDSLGERLRRLRSYGWRERYLSEERGINSRLDEIQAAILRVKLRHLEAETTRRQEIARQYQHSLGMLPLQLPRPSDRETHVYHQFVIRLPQRDRLREFLRQQNIETAVLYPAPIHLQPAYRDRLAIHGSLGATEQAARELLCLPIHPWLSDEDVAAITAAIHRWHHE